MNDNKKIGQVKSSIHDNKGVCIGFKSAHASEPWSVTRIEAIIRDNPSTWKSVLAFELNATKPAHASERGADNLLRDIRAGVQGSRGRCLTCDSIAADIDKHFSQRPTPATEGNK